MVYLPSTPRQGLFARMTTAARMPFPPRPGGISVLSNPITVCHKLPSPAKANNCDWLPGAIIGCGELKTSCHIHEGKVITQAGSRGF